MTKIVYRRPIKLGVCTTSGLVLLLAHQRRHLSESQQAMATAKLYPSGGQRRQRGKLNFKN
jgi:hypothetical protein